MPTDKEPLTFHLTEWELSDWRDLLAQLKELRLVPLTLTLPKLTLRMVRTEAEQLRHLLAEGQIAQAAAMLGISKRAPSAERTEQGTMPRQPKVSEPTPATPDDQAPKRRPGRPKTGAHKASITFSLPVDLIAWLVEIGGKDSMSPTVERLLRAAKDRGEV